MFDFGYFTNGLIGLFGSIIQLYMYIVLARVVVSWINADPNNPIIQFLRAITDPVLDRLRGLLPSFFWSTGLDFTPLILIVILEIALLGLRSLRLG